MVVLYRDVVVSGAETHDGGSLTLARLSDGTLFLQQKVSGGNTTGKRYCGSFVFTSGTGNTTPQVESVAWDEGRIFADAAGNYRDCWFAGDHLGNVRSVLDITPDVTFPVPLEQNDYLPFGTKIANPLHVQMNTNRWRYAGKEEFPDLNQLDFGARMYDPFTARWTAMDPMAEKYYSISPYAYCADDPVTLVDLDGMDWYSYLDNGRKYYHYEGGQLSEKEMKENGYTYVGKTALEGDTYYSLFGKIISISQDNIEGELYQAIDKLIMNYIESVKWTPSSPFDQDIPSSKTDFSRVKSEKPFSFIYEGRSFSSELDGTLFSPISSSTFRGQVIKGDSMLIMRRFPSDNNMGYGGPAPTGNMRFWRDGRWLIGESSQKRGHPLQIRFSDQNAARFLQAVNNLFHTNFRL